MNSILSSCINKFTSSTGINLTWPFYVSSDHTTNDEKIDDLPNIIYQQEEYHARIIPPIQDENDKFAVKDDDNNNNEVNLQTNTSIEIIDIIENRNENKTIDIELRLKQKLHENSHYLKAIGVILGVCAILFFGKNITKKTNPQRK